MMRRAFPLIALAAALAGCNPEPATKTIRQQEADVEAKAATMTGWDRAFRSPATTIPSVNQFGLRAEPYAGTAGAYASKGVDKAISNTFAKAPNQVSFAATGASAEAIDELRFGLAITDPPAGAQATERFAKLVTDFMFVAKVPGGDKVGPAITAAKPATMTLDGAGFALDVKPIDGAKGDRLLTVTFTRPDTKSAAKSS